MRPCSSWLWVWLVAGCGRVGFDDLSGSGAGGVVDAASGADGAGTAPNFVFVTSATTVLGELGSLAAADAFCSDAATDAGLMGTYVAFLSTSAVAAQDRIAGARGWIRLDGMPVVDTVAELEAGQALHPILLDELGYPVRARVGTTTKLGGIATTCGDLMSTAGMTHGGYSDATGTFLASGTSILGCGAGVRLYCFGIDRVAPLPALAPVVGKRMFVSPATATDGGLAALDAKCNATASAAGLVGTFMAVLPSGGLAASTRFVGTVGPIVRVDGVKIAASAGALFLGQLDSPPNQTADGTYGDDAVLAGTAAETCTDWTENSSAGVSRGFSSLAQAGFLGGAYGVFINQTCGASVPVYCLESQGQSAVVR